MWTLCFLYWHLLFSRNFPKNITCSTFLQDCFCDYDWESWNFFYPSLLGQSGRSQTSSTWVNASVLRTSQVIRRKIEHIIREQTALVIGMLVHKDCKSWGVTHSYFVDEEKSWNRIWFFSRNQSFFRHSIYQYHILDDWLCKKLGVISFDGRWDKKPIIKDPTVTRDDDTRKTKGANCSLADIKESFLLSLLDTSSTFPTN